MAGGCNHEGLETPGYQVTHTLTTPDADKCQPGSPKCKVITTTKFANGRKNVGITGGPSENCPAIQVIITKQ